MAEQHSYDSWGSAGDRFAEGALCIGIDLGTTNSCAGMWMVDRNHVKILKNRADRGRTTPSVVRFDPDSEQALVGNAAVARETDAPVGNTVRSVKRLMGQKFDSKAVQVARRFASYSVAATAQGNAAIPVQRRRKAAVVQPEEVSALVLAELKASAEAYFDGDKRIDNAVITVPAYFNDSQRKATITSASMAGFKAVRLLNEPTAAAMAYGLFLAGTKLVVVFDFGGGTLDVSLMQIQEGKFEVLGIGGDTNLGGEDINNLLVDHVLEMLDKHHDIHRAQLSAEDMVRVKRAVEKGKIALSSEETAEIELPPIGGKRVSITLHRRKFELLCESIWKKCLRIVSSVLKEAEVSVEDVDEVILVGGSTRIPVLRSKISELFHDKELCMSVNADEVVCEGAAIQAAILSGMDKKVFRDVLMLDVIPLPIGIETADGAMEVLLPKNSRIPVSLTKYFKTFEDGQRGLTVEVYEGESAVAKENDHICYFNFALPRAKIGKAGEFEHPVTLTMNASGVLQVQAGIHHDDEEEPMSTTALALLAAYLAALLALYVFSRMYFADERAVTAV